MNKRYEYFEVFGNIMAFREDWLEKMFDNVIVHDIPTRSPRISIIGEEHPGIYMDNMSMTDVVRWIQEPITPQKIEIILRLRGYIPQ